MDIIKPFLNLVLPICVDWWWWWWWWSCLAKCPLGRANSLYCWGGAYAVQWGHQTICFQDNSSWICLCEIGQINWWV